MTQPARYERYPVKTDPDLADEARQALAEAAEYITKHGWTQDCYRDPETGAVCALGAIWSARGNVFRNMDGSIFINDSDMVADQANRLLGNYLNRTTECGGNVPSWNDHPSRTAEDVILAMKTVANED